MHQLIQNLLSNKTGGISMQKVFAEKNMDLLKKFPDLSPELQKYIRDLEEKNLYLENQNVQLKLLADSVLEILLLCQLDGSILQGNVYTYELLEYEVGELCQQSFQTVATFPSSECAHLEELEPGTSLVLEGVFRKKNGKTFSLPTKITRVRQSYGDVVVIWAHKFLQQSMAQENLRLSNLHIQQEWNQTGIGIVEVSGQTQSLGKMLRFNPAFEKIVACGEEFLKKKNFFDFVHPDDRVSYQLELHRLLKKEKTRVDQQIRLMQPKEKVKWTRLKASLVEDSRQSHPSYFLMFIEDITKHKDLEEQLRQAVKMEAIGQLAGGVAHDFNNLLTVITGHSAIMMSKLKGKSPFYRNAEEIHKAADRAGKLTRQLLTFSRKQVLEPKVFDLSSVVLDIDRLLRRMIGEDIELISRPAAKDKALVRADPGQIEQVLMNLAVNARDAMPNGGQFFLNISTVKVSEEDPSKYLQVKPGEYVLLTASDTGMGMEQEIQKRIFEPFFTTKGNGTGLGLSTVYGIIKQSGGYIFVDSEVETGTIFRIYLPRVKQNPTEEKEVKEAPASQGSGTILVVEDEQGIRALVKENLEAYGYSVFTASSAQEATQIFAKEQQWDLLVTDVILPKTKGTELAQSLQARLPKLKVLYISGYDRELLKQRGEEINEKILLAKPFSPLELVLKVSKLLLKENHQSAKGQPPKNKI